MNHHSPSAVADAAYAHIRNRVLNGQLKPGTRLVTRTLASEIGSSINPVREALGRLAAERVVDHIPGAGAFVHDGDWQELDDQYDFREAVEPHAAARAARFITDAELDELWTICEQERSIAYEIRALRDTVASDDIRARWIDAEERFHDLILKAARNQVMHRAISECRLLARIFMRHRQMDALLDLPVAARTWHRHRRLVNAIQSGERTLAAELMRKQIQDGRRHVVSLFRNEQRTQL